jgi:hypothetical protein
MKAEWFLLGALVGFGLLLFKLKKAGLCCGGKTIQMAPVGTVYNAPPLQSQCYVQAPSQFIQ